MVLIPGVVFGWDRQDCSDWQDREVPEAGERQQPKLTPASLTCFTVKFRIPLPVVSHDCHCVLALAWDVLDGRCD